MQLRQLRYFLGVAEAGSLLAASRQLYVAQPALGQQISALEEELGARLFERSRTGMRLTDAGSLFIEYARVILADVERAKRTMRDFSQVPCGKVSLGLPTTVALIAALPLLQACREQLPQVQLNLIEAYSGFLREWLKAGRVDVAVLMGDGADADLELTPMLVDRLMFVTGKTTRRMPRRLSMDALADWPLILPGPEHGLRRIIEKASQGHAALNVVAEMDALGAVKRAVQIGLGSTILPQGAVAEEVEQGLLKTVCIDSPLMDRRVLCAINVTRPQTIAAAAVHALVRQVFYDMVVDGSWPARWIGKQGSRVM